MAHFVYLSMSYTVRSSSKDVPDRNLDSFKKRSNKAGRGFDSSPTGLPPLAVLQFEKHKSEAEYAYRWIRKHSRKVPPGLSPQFEAWLAFLLKSLSYWELIPIGQPLGFYDYLYGNLITGPSFATWLKKVRAYTLQANIAIGDVAVPEEYYIPGWEGYDSFYPETGLIHWEEEIDDFPFSMYPVSEDKIPKRIETYCYEELMARGPKDLPLVGTSDVLRFVKASKGYTLDKNRSLFIRDFISELGKPNSIWWGKRCKIQAMPGGARDTAMSEPNTLIKIKLANEIFIKICEDHPNSAMASKSLQSRRISRLWKSKFFLHLDFKKVGLMLPRAYLLALGKSIESVYGIDMSWYLGIKDIYVQSEGETFRTARGYTLGWMNEAVTLIIIILIRKFLSILSLKLDFLVFNDDVEIALPESWIDYPESCYVFKTLICRFFEERDIFVSIKKTYCSRESIFLEEYHAPESRFDFQKRSIATRIYAKAAVSTYPFLRKSYVNIASQIWFCSDIISEIVDYTKPEFPLLISDETGLPFEAGGFFSCFESGFNTLMTEYPGAVWLASLLSEYSQEPIETSKPKFDFSIKKHDRNLDIDVSKHRFTVPAGLSAVLEELKETFHQDSDEELLARVEALPDDAPFRRLASLPFLEMVKGRLPGKDPPSPVLGEELEF